MLEIKRQKNRGDTIVEALISLAIAAFAVGIAYATANRSLQQAITARERNQALNLIQNQITDLRIRYANETVANFKTDFGIPPVGTPNNHFCMDDQATDPTQTSNPQWLPYFNNNSSNNLDTVLGSNYNNTVPGACVRNIAGQGTPFYIDITTSQAPSQAASINDTVFRVFVRWERVGGGPVNQASLFYRPNGNG